MVLSGFEGEFEESAEEAVGFGRGNRFLFEVFEIVVRGFVDVLVDREAFEESGGVEFAVELHSVNHLAVEAEGLVGTLPRGREFDRAGGEFGGVVVMTHVGEETGRDAGEEGVGAAGGGELDGVGSDLAAIVVGDDGAAEGLGDELVAPAGAEQGAAGITETFD